MLKSILKMKQMTRRLFMSLCFCLLLINVGLSQTKLLSVQKVEDYSQSPFFDKITEDNNGEKQWKAAYSYIDSIDLYQLTYLSDGLKVKGWIARPQKKGMYPAIVYNRGGNREFGALKMAHGLVFLGQLAKEGYVVVASNYRGNGGSEGQEEFGGQDVNDILNLINILHEIDGIDTSKVGLYGWSRGAMMTYMTLKQKPNVKAVVTGGGKADMTIIDRPNMESNVYAQLIPDYEANKSKELEKRSVVKWVNLLPKNVPILLLHGNADWRVKSTNSLQLALEFEKYRIPYRLKIFEGADHGITEYKKEVHEEVISWFNRFLKQGEELPNMEFHGK